MKTLTLMGLLVSQIAFASDYEVRLSASRYNEEYGYYGTVYVRNKSDETTQDVRIKFRLYQDEDFQLIGYDSQPCFVTLDNIPYDVFPDYAENLDENTGDFIIPELKPHQEFNFAVVWPEKPPLIYGFVTVQDNNNGYGKDDWIHRDITTAMKDALNEKRVPLIKLDYQGEHNCLITSSLR